MGGCAVSRRVQQGHGAENTPHSVLTVGPTVSQVLAKLGDSQVRGREFVTQALPAPGFASAPLASHPWAVTLDPCRGSVSVTLSSEACTVAAGLGGELGAGRPQPAPGGWQHPCLKVSRGPLAAHGQGCQGSVPFLPLLFLPEAIKERPALLTLSSLWGRR